MSCPNCGKKGGRTMTNPLHFTPEETLKVLEGVYDYDVKRVTKDINESIDRKLKDHGVEYDGYKNDNGLVFVEWGDEDATHTATLINIQPIEKKCDHRTGDMWDHHGFNFCPKCGKDLRGAE